jgi:hypothetical protein
MAEPVLFEVFEYDLAFAEFVHTTIHELMTRKDPLLSRIKAVPVTQLPTVRNTMESGEVVETEPIKMAMPFSVDLTDAIKGNFENLAATLDNAAEEGLKTLMPRFFEDVGRLSQAAGTATDAGGQPISRELIRKGLENVEIDFDEDGNPIMPTMWVNPEMAEQIRRLPPETEAETRAFQELIERKRREFNDRRRHRKLS